MQYLTAILVLLCLGGCAGGVPPERVSRNQPTVAAERLIDAFYSYEPNRLLSALADAPDSQPQLLFYQGWAEGGNYAIIDRQPCQSVDENEITCAVTVRDDLIAALGTGYWVTDKFHLTIREGRIITVRNSSNDPPEFELALNWLRRERPEMMVGPCRGFFAGGPSPQDCVRAVVEGFKTYKATQPIAGK